MSLCLPNSMRTLSSYFRTYGEIRPDAKTDMRPGAPLASADSYDSLMEVASTGMHFPDSKKLTLCRVGQPEAKITGEAQGNTHWGELHMVEQQRATGTKGESDDIYFRGNQVVAFHESSKGNASSITVDLLNRADPSQNEHWELAPGTKWLSGSTDYREIDHPKKR